MTTQSIVSSDQLVPIFLGQIDGQAVQVCDARALHAYLQSDTRFNDWIKARIEKYEFQESQDFVSFTENSVKPAGGRPSTEYHLSLDMAKELAMVENNQRGRLVRRYFIAMERKALELAIPPASADLANLAKVIRAWAETARSQADMALALATECERRITAEAQATPTKPKQLPDKEAAFIQAWWDCLGSQTVTASDLYRAVATKQCQELNNSSDSLLGDITQWTAKKLSHALRRWSQQVLDSHAVRCLGKSSHGLLWRLELANR